MLLVVGLGNPGEKYASHRHNVGFMAVEALAARARADAFREKFSGVWARATLGDEPGVLLQPMTYMNESGRSVQPALAFFKIAPKELVVIHDELDLPFGDVRLKFGGGHAGHNGLRSIMSHVGTGDFARVRVGVGRPPPGYRGEVADYVLSPFDAVERSRLPDILKLVTDSVLEVATRGFDAAMNVRNSRPKAGKKQAKERSEAPTSPEPANAKAAVDKPSVSPGEKREGE
ncbi:aminoacyl-tRNA hydrolase [Polyangium jinanense]|uniref:Peptidyl-tRNA hydrolase n=1 Tax=Polyangium jinanense TaxID=2829994 RepID=A0A9X3WZW4_9BACT|nr:aminoacyl-tRNA hydrolase [Polyangium jinanense]MDC3955051.1 aminoacyl-tRNA hydrolase [Polyangium jinanense]MDC3981179.1 aminoacyl-tRNA hydrolase [Polyangium jinanense]